MSVTVRVRALAYGGAFIGDVVEGPAESVGKRAFIPFVAPGELVRASIVKDEKRFVQAAIEEIVERSDDRVEAPCQYFAKCGGCDLQHLPIARQRALKREMIETMLRAQAGLTPKNGVRDASAGLPDYAYRRRVTLHLSEDGALGFFRAGTGEVIDIERCIISSMPINETLAALRMHVGVLQKSVAAIVIDQGAGDSVAVVLRPREGGKIPNNALETLRRTLPSHLVRTDAAIVDDESDQAAGHFSQVNARGNEIILAAVLEWIGEAAVTEFYAGSGNFSLPLAARGSRVTAVEVDPALTALGEKLAAERSLTSRIRFVTSSCERYVKKNAAEAAVLLDPPRSGAKEIVQRLDPMRTKEIVYVSCNLPSLARDLKILAARDFELIETRFIDMFPQTHHVETVSLLRTR